MDSVKINRDELLKIVRDNKEKHVAEFKEAIADYKRAVVKISEENIALINADNLQLKPLPHKTTSYEANYNRAIRMLELSVENVIELNQYDFAKLVLDEWEWKEMFSTMNSTYKALI